MALTQEYFHLLNQYQQEYGTNTILLMQVGSFFEVYAKDLSANIQSFSKLCDLNVVEKDKTKIWMAGFKDIQLERYLKKIQEGGFTAVVYTQDDTKNRTLAGIFSPGTYFSDSPRLSNSITCIWVEVIEQKVVNKGNYTVIGIANIDIYTGKTGVFQYKEERNTTYDQLERFLSITRPSEVLLISNQDMDPIIRYAGIECTLLHKIHTEDPTYKKRLVNCEKQTYQKEILSRFYTHIEPFYDYTLATQAFCYLLDFVYQHNPYLVHKLAEPEWKTEGLVLANHSLKQLNLLDDGSVKSGKHSCVTNLLNECVTPMGKRRFTELLLHPICDEHVLQKEYDMTEYMLDHPHEWSELSHIKDLTKWERQVYLNKTTPLSFVQLYDQLHAVKRLYASCEDHVRTYLKVKDVDVCCDTLQAFICIHLNVEVAREDSFDVNIMRRGIDEALDQQYDRWLETEEKIKSIQVYLNGLIEWKEKKNTDYLKWHETEKHQLGLISTKRRCKLLLDAMPTTTVTLRACGKPFAYTVDKSQVSFEAQSATNSFVVEPQLQALCTSWTTLKHSMKDLVACAFGRFVKQFETLQPQLETVIQCVTLMDVIHTKASIAKKYKYCKPVLVDSEKSFVDAKQLRHALIEQFQTSELYVANDVALGRESWLLYGTNAVGKTSLIRALGIAVIMAQAGLYVPCTTFSYKPYRTLFTRILGNDNLFKGLSTFAVEMSELRTILNMSNANSLILGDELCSGTETQSAISIFVAGIQHLHQRKSSFLFATHLHEITEYEEITSLNTVKMKHMAVVYNPETGLVYDRKLKDGSGDTMYGLEVCKSLQLPADFMEAAYNIRSKYHSTSLLNLKTSRYNVHKLVGRCEKCGGTGQEVHHIHFQKEAVEGFIQTQASVFHKNHLANLMTVCERCHDEIHLR
jgi:DNA mismatch repair protein MutS|uniref:DNA mismatch repair proteins mutS family domain-containing protein n=1 Tax=viral metagenome TaxID=1070528 RepID=A0A6C0AH50_9ZZZZ